MKVKNKRAIIPNTLTTLNIFSGFVSLIFAGEKEFILAAYFIGIAAIFDVLDGLFARLLGTSSEYGVQLDSLGDTISFGAAPAMLIYQAYLIKFGFWGIILSALLLIFGALRLARFNIQVEDLSVKENFKGLPIPLSALTVASFIYMFKPSGIPVEPFTYIVFPLILLLSGLLVSTVPYNAMPKFHKSMFSESPFLVAFVALSVVILIFIGIKGIFYIFITLILFGILRYLLFLILGKNPNHLKVKNKTN